MKLRIVEMSYGNIAPTMFEVYESGVDVVYNPPIFESKSLHEAIDFCYAAGVNFEVDTLAAWKAGHL